MTRSQFYSTSLFSSTVRFRLDATTNGAVELTNGHSNGSTVHEKSPPSGAEHGEATTQVSPRKNFRLYLCLTISSLGVIFGDIGTSPLYVLRTVFAENPSPTEKQCIGAVSLIIWNLLIVVSIKYAVFILMADNRGEGGTFALCGLLTGEKSRLRARAKHVVSIVSIFAASLLIGTVDAGLFPRWRDDDRSSILGDGALTPAISVLSAVEGITTTSTTLSKWILPITVVIIILLFFVQMFGTSKIGNIEHLR